MDKVAHFEIPFDDAKRAEAFYSKVFGWGMNFIPEMNYHFVRTVDVDDKQMPKEAGAINGGMYKRGGTSADYPVIVIEVANVDDYIKKAKKAGGKVAMEKRVVGDRGFYAQIFDTEGNIIGIWEYSKK